MEASVYKAYKGLKKESLSDDNLDYKNVDEKLISYKTENK